ncbi:RagB/SusD family nutrient uptake outer membrane protein [Pedobacter nutrimenti]|uniref:RagB/SusD family nutrient uptake outer membrane protein n=1 Tax=Pedobacter nutrimenti TaxID=1241337 RepID=UPI00292EFA48|nr:RagB/SusD family nutrient uptake outer membrane protein [Pedobacter nutrimenti]
MKSLKYTCFLILMVLGSTGCKKYLDIVPKGKIIPQTANDFRLLLDQTTPKGKSNGFVNSFSNDVLMGDDMEINAFSASFYKASDQNVFTFAENIYQDFESDPDWEALYNQIYVTNLVITQVMDAEGGTTSEKTELLSEAKVQRAYAYLILVNLYAKQYNPATAAADPGVPLRKGLDFEEKLPRATVQEVYDYILQDLKQALGNLPVTPQLNLNFRPVEAAAYALLARTSLYMNNIAGALDYANNSLQRYSGLIDYNTLPASQLFPGTIQEPIGLQNKELLLLKSVVSPSSFFYGNVGLIGLYDQQNDLRFKARFASDAAFGLNNGFICTEWSGKTPSKGPSTAEMLLVRAECYARAGKTAEAINDLNTLRSTRYKTGSIFALSASSSAQALLLVKQERRRELAFLGFRWFDIKRYNVFDNDQISVVHTINGATYTLAPNSPRSVLPIGRKYIDLNPEIIQNPH